MPGPLAAQGAAATARFGIPSRDPSLGIVGGRPKPGAGGGMPDAAGRGRRPAGGAAGQRTLLRNGGSQRGQVREPSIGEMKGGPVVAQGPGASRRALRQVTGDVVTTTGGSACFGANSTCQTINNYCYASGPGRPPPGLNPLHNFDNCVSDVLWIVNLSSHDQQQQQWWRGYKQLQNKW